MFTPSFGLRLIIQLSLNHIITLKVIVKDSWLKTYMSQRETIGGVNQLSYKAFGQLQIIYTLELSSTLVPKSFRTTSISLYPSIYNRLLLDFCFLWKNTFFDCILETNDFIRWCCILSLKFIHNLSIDFKLILFEMRIFYTS